LKESANATLTSETFTAARCSAFNGLDGTLAHAESAPKATVASIKRILDVL
jgi:hypothetical protein